MNDLREILHRHVWQRLPYGLRRKVLFATSALIAPRLSVNVSPEGPIVVVGALRTASGLGRSARLCHDALAAACCDVRGIDLTSTLMQSEDGPSFKFVDGSSCKGAGVLLVFVNAPFLPMTMLRLGALVRDKYVVGYWAWELPSVPDEWRRGISFVHEIWVPSSFVANAIRPMASGRPIRVMSYPVSSREGCIATRRTAGQDTFNVLTIFNAASGFERKNPLATVKAFRDAFGDDQTARLTIKTSNLSVFAAGARKLSEIADDCPNIILLDKTMDDGELEKLYCSADVFISLHRAEGFGLTLAEAMLHGLPVVATNWSGNVDFLNQETGVPIHCHLVPAEDPQSTYHHPEMVWAEPDVYLAATALRRLRGDPALRARIGAQAAESAQKEFSAIAFAERVLSHLSVGSMSRIHGR